MVLVPNHFFACRSVTYMQAIQRVDSMTSESTRDDRIPLTDHYPNLVWYHRINGPFYLVKIDTSNSSKTYESNHTIRRSGPGCMSSRSGCWSRLRGKFTSARNQKNEISLRFEGVEKSIAPFQIADDKIEAIMMVSVPSHNVWGWIDPNKWNRE